jgi:hypothetical protein
VVRVKHRHPLLHAIARPTATPNVLVLVNASAARVPKAVVDVPKALAPVRDPLAPSASAPKIANVPRSRADVIPSKIIGE